MCFGAEVYGSWGVDSKCIFAIQPAIYRSTKGPRGPGPKVPPRLQECLWSVFGLLAKSARTCSEVFGHSESPKTYEKQSSEQF